jgi:hypothetical protein
MTPAQRLARVRLVVNKLALRGGRDAELVELLEDVCVDLAADARGGASVLHSRDDMERIEVELDRLVHALSKENRRHVLDALLDVDGHAAILDVIEERVRLARLIERTRTG